MSALSPSPARLTARPKRSVLASAAALLASSALALAVAPSADAAFGQIGARWGSAGTAAGQLPAQPFRVAVDATTGLVYVATAEIDDQGAPTGKSWVVVYQADGAAIRTIPLDSGAGVFAGRIAVDGPRKKLYVMQRDNANGATSILQYSTDDLASAPTPFLSAAATAPDVGGFDIAVDQSTDAATGGRLFVAYSALADPNAEGHSGFVTEYSKAGALVRRVGSVYGGDEPISPSGTFPTGSIIGVEVASGSHNLLVRSGGQIEAFAPAGTPVAGTIAELPTYSFLAATPGGGYYAATSDVPAESPPAQMELRSPLGARQLLFGLGRETLPLASCQYIASSGGSAAVGPDGSLYMASSNGKPVLSELRTSVLRLGQGGTGCGFDPVVNTLTADLPSPLVGDAVKLTATGQVPGGGALTYAWDLDGDTATGPDGFEVSGPETSRTVTSGRAASRTVRVRVSDAGGSKSAIRSLDLQFKAKAPRAAFTVSSAAISAGASITFDASTSAGDEPITRYEWDLGSGIFDVDSGASPTTSKAFGTAGTYRVRVRVTAGGQTTTSPSQTIAVNAAPAPPAPAPAAATPPAPAKPGAPLASIGKLTAATALKGSVSKGLTLKITCAPGGPTCTGSITLTSAGKGKAVTYARVLYSAPAGKSVTLKLKLKSAGKKALKKAKSAKAVLLVTPIGGAAAKTNVKLKLARK